MRSRALRARRSLALNITSDQGTLYNAFTAAGSPGTRRRVVLTIASGVVLHAGLDQGPGWAPGTTFVIINNGTVAGVAGAGGAGSGVASSQQTAAGVGGAGGHAVVLRVPTTIDNTNGYILGGGGGGGGGGSVATSSPPGPDQAAAGGGGGGGRGYNAPAGGAAGVGNDTAIPAEAGGAGSSGAPGSGSIGGRSGIGDGGSGGSGGQWGSAGQDGVLPNYPGRNIGLNGLGGAAGKAVAVNGQSLTWIGGNNSTQVQGAVS